MKSILKFLILCLGLVVAQGAMAVVLPSQSYVPDPSDYMVYYTDENGAVTVIGSAFAMLGDATAGPIETYCKTTYSTVAQKAMCTQCCSDKEEEACKQDPANCASTYEVDADSCRATCSSYSLPLDCNIYFILALAVAFGAAKAFSATAQQRLKLSV